MNTRPQQPVLLLKTELPLPQQERERERERESVQEEDGDDGATGGGRWVIILHGNRLL